MYKFLKELRLNNTKGHTIYKNKKDIPINSLKARNGFNQHYIMVYSYVLNYYNDNENLFKDSGFNNKQIMQ